MEKKLISEQDDNFTHLVKKAQRKSLKRSITVSLIVTVISLFVIWAFLYIGQYFMYESMQKQADEIYDEFTLRGANVYPGGTTYDHFFFASRMQTTAYKEVNGHLINWDTRSFFHTIIGTNSAIEDNNWLNVDGHTYVNNHKSANFHLPEEETKQTNSTIAYLESLPEFYSVEVAVSFNEELPLSTVSTSFPNAKWLWVIQDGLYDDVEKTKKVDEQIAPLLIQDDYSEQAGDNVYGFPIIQQAGENAFLSSAETYRTFVENLFSEDTAQETPIKKTLDNYEAIELPIAGVILTGTVATILEEINNEYVRIVRTGIIIPY